MKLHITNSNQGTALFHVVAIVTVAIWGGTFVSTKILINHGLAPIEIFLYRFLLAYLCIIPFSMRKLFADNVRDELMLLLCGLCGGSLYFISENTALGITFASNVSLLICTAPIFTMLLGSVCFHQPLRKWMLGGSLLALVGVGMVVYNGSMDLGVNPLGDFLALVAALLWACYSVMLRRLGYHYSTFFITRKVFFYGLLTASLFLIITSSTFNFGKLSIPVVWINLLFLGFVASMLCYVMWNAAVKVIGAAKTSNYIYCVPLVTILASVIFLSEPVTAVMLLGTVCIIGGVYIAER